MKTNTTLRQIIAKEDGLRRLEKNMKSNSIICRIFGHFYKPFDDTKPKGNKICRFCDYMDKREDKSLLYNIDKMHLPYIA